MTVSRRTFIQGAGVLASALTDNPATAGDPVVVDVRDFGAMGDGLDSSAQSNDAAIEKALAAVPTYGTITFPAARAEYVLDAEHFITRPVTLLGAGGRLRVKAQSSLFHDGANPWARYLFHIRSSDVTVRGLTIDGHSRNNYSVIAGTRYYLKSDVGNNLGAGILIVGFYGRSITPMDLF